MTPSWLPYAEGVGQFQPRVAATLGQTRQRTVNAEGVGQWLRGRSRTPPEFASCASLNSQGCGNPGLELANAFGVIIAFSHSLGSDQMLALSQSRHVILASVESLDPVATRSRLRFRVAIEFSSVLSYDCVLAQTLRVAPAIAREPNSS